jgi:hypothetical protein
MNFPKGGTDFNNWILAGGNQSLQFIQFVKN